MSKIHGTIEKLHLQPHDIVVVSDARTAEAILATNLLPLNNYIVVAPTGLEAVPLKKLEELVAKLKAGI